MTTAVTILAATIVVIITTNLVSYLILAVFTDTADKKTEE